METLKITKVTGVYLDKSLGCFASKSTREASMTEGTLHLMAQQMLFTWQLGNSSESAEFWVSYCDMFSVERKSAAVANAYSLHIVCRNHFYFRLVFSSETEARDVLDSILSVYAGVSETSLEKSYAFNYVPKRPFSTQGWQIYSVMSEYDRLGVGSPGNFWRLSDLSATYPRTLVVPSKISDTVLFHAAKFRSKGRLPSMTFTYPLNNASITRCSQPLVGLKAKRSIQDEKLIEAIFDSNMPSRSSTGSTDSLKASSAAANLIIDARPLGNAMANRAMGAGTESMENYKNCKRLFMGIENIHVMRDSRNKYLEDVVQQPENGADKFLSSIDATNWPRHIRTILESAVIIIESIKSGSHVLIHCSDGWDRTAQLSSLASIALDPFYRTIEGFEVLIEKEWLSFGHKFSDRCGHFLLLTSGTSSKKEQETAPVFLQFLECVKHLRTQHPDLFQFNDRFLIEIFKASQSTKFGTFMLNNERSRTEAKLSTRTQSFWSFLNENLDDFKSSCYLPSDLREFPISTLPKDVNFWCDMYAVGDDIYGGELSNRASLSFEPFEDALDGLQERLDELRYVTAGNIRDKQVLKEFLTRKAKRQICCICRSFQFVLEKQWRCRQCSRVVCQACSRYKSHDRSSRSCDECWRKKS